MSFPVTEGTVPYIVPDAGKDCFTWYKIFGNLSDSVPLIALHGGPGSPHNYMVGFADLTEKYGIPVILYDSIGCGNSTLIPEKRGDVEFWTCELLERELDNLVERLGLSKFNLLGHSWGGMLAAKYVGDRSNSSKIGKIVLLNTPASVPDFLQGVGERRLQLPKDVQETIIEHESKKDFDAPAYKEAVGLFYKQFFCRCESWPKELLEARAIRARDPTVYETMYGPTEVTCTGNLKDFTVLPLIYKIKNPTLLVTGEFDEVTDTAAAPLFENMPDIKWRVLPNASHMAMWEQREELMRLVSSFIRSEV